MKLSPVRTKRHLAYPPLLTRPARQLLSALSLSAALLAGGGGCASTEQQVEQVTASSGQEGAEKQASTNRRLRVCEPDPRLSGDMIAPAVPPFTCGSAHRASMPEQQLPLSPVAGRLCGSQTGWAGLRIPSRSRVRFLLQGPTSRIELRSPSRDRVFELTERQSCVELDMEPGLWVLAARPTSPEVGDHGFELWAEVVP